MATASGLELPHEGITPYSDLCLNTSVRTKSRNYETNYTTPDRRRSPLHLSLNFPPATSPRDWLVARILLELLLDYHHLRYWVIFRLAGNKFESIWEPANSPVWSRLIVPLSQSVYTRCNRGCERPP